jgi:hypothetical protein
VTLLKCSSIASNGFLGMATPSRKPVLPYFKANLDAIALEKDGKYVQIVGYNVTGVVGDFDSYKKIEDYGDFDRKFGGGRIIFCIPSGLKPVVKNKKLDLDNPLSNWYRFGSVGDPSEKAYYNLLVRTSER